MWEKPPPTRHTHILYMKARQVVGRKGGSVQNCRRFGQHFCPPWQCDCQGLVMRLPRAGNAIAKGWQCDCQGPAIRLPRAGTSSARGWYFECPRLVLRVPAAGTSSARGWEHDSQGPGTLFPRAGNSIPKGVGKMARRTRRNQRRRYRLRRTPPMSMKPGWRTLPRS